MTALEDDLVGAVNLNLIGEIAAVGAAVSLEEIEDGAEGWFAENHNQHAPKSWFAGPASWLSQIDSPIIGPIVKINHITNRIIASHTIYWTTPLLSIPAALLLELARVDCDCE